MLPVTLLTLLGVGAVLHFVHGQITTTAQHEFSAGLEGSRAYWHSELKQAQQRHESLLTVLMNRPGFPAALARRDQSGVAALLQRTLGPLEEMGSDTSLSLFDSSGEPLLEPQTAAPLPDRRSRAGPPASGVMLDAAGELRLYSHWAIEQDGKRFGSALFSEPLAPLLDNLAALFQHDPLLLIERRRLESLDNPQPKLLSPQVERYPQHLLLNPPEAGLPPALRTLLERGETAPLAQGVNIEAAGRHYFAGTIALQEHDGETLGSLIILRNITPAYQALLRSLLYLYLGTLAATLLPLTLLYVLTRRSEGDALDAYRQLEASNRAIAHARQEWNDAFDAITDPIFIHDADFRILRANRAYAERAGLSFKQLIGRPYYDVFPQHDGPLPHCQRALHDVRHETARKPHEDHFTLPGGEQFISRSFFTVDEQGQYRYSVHLLEEITERERMAEALRRENRTRKMISASNMALVRAEDEQELLQRICHTITELGGYNAAWVGFAKEDGALQLAPVAYAGLDAGQVEKLRQRLADPNYRESPANRAFTEGRIALISDPGDQHSPHCLLPTGDSLQCASVLATPLVNGGEVLGVLSIHTSEQGRFSDAELALLNELAGDLAYGLTALRSRHQRDRAERARLKLVERLEQSLNKTVQAMATALEVRDPYTAGHQRNVATIATALARSLGFDDEQTEGVRIAATIHDLGKISIPAEILSKPGRLSEVEYQIVKTHSEVGYNILKGIDFPWPVATMVHQHHERLDGSGYPQGLKGEAILPGAQVIGVADVVEAIASHRPYRPALGIDQALEELERGRGIRYETRIVDACTTLFREEGFRFEAH
ncbi:MAG: HD domain-containing phosphohydrolase [Pseudomonadota bacterium]